MKKLARVLLWIGVFVFVLDWGSLIGARRGAIAVFRVQDASEQICRARQAVLVDVDKSAWTDQQRGAFDSTCDLPKEWHHDFGPALPHMMMAIALLLGGMLYLVAVIREAWRKGLLEIERPDSPTK